MADTLPKEMWIHIWSFIDFDTLQKICTVVCKSWLDEIRDSAQLSSELKFDNEGKVIYPMYFNPIPTTKKSYVKDLPWAESAHV